VCRIWSCHGRNDPSQANPEAREVSRPSGQLRDDDYDVICEGAVVGRVFCRRLRRRSGSGCGRLPTATTKTHTDAWIRNQRARPRWPPSGRAGVETRPNANSQ
jgi:hypothetical protein